MVNRARAGHMPAFDLMAAVDKQPYKPTERRSGIIKPVLKPSVFQKKTISGAEIMKRPVKDIKSRTRRRNLEGLEYQLDSYNVFERRLEGNAEALTNVSKALIQNAHSLLTANLSSTRAREVQQVAECDRQVSTTFAPLSRAQVHTVFNNPHTNITQTTTSQIGERIKTFEAQIVTLEKDLESAWDDHFELEIEMAILGRDVFGDEVVVGLDEESEARIEQNKRQKGGLPSFNELSRTSKAENDSGISMLQDEAKAWGAEALRRMNKLDKDLNNQENAEKKQLLISIQT